ncbi:hypothetical protein B0H14DRAFT_2604197 [Mycena olivaceomarginata]|nr:hypothetical protein B0H14DRAFT_2604197 [Mycena olivaceomarginata]
MSEEGRDSKCLDRATTRRRQGRVTEEKHAPPGDEKGRESERGKDGRQRKSTHDLETRSRGRVREARMGDRGKAHTLWRREGEGEGGRVSEARMGTEEKHALPGDKKGARVSKGKDGQLKQSTHKLEIRRGGSVSEARMGDRKSTHFLET